MPARDDVADRLADRVRLGFFDCSSQQFVNHRNFTDHVRV
jgi:hypothetical protein